MASAPALDTLVQMDLPDETATEALAEALARIAGPGDVFALHGALGVGKTTFARAFIHARARMRGGDADEEVPSPTFTLLQTYDLPGGTVYHFDLFRIENPDETDELGFDEAACDGIALVEWPERLGPRLPARRLEVGLALGATPDFRRATLAGGEAWRRRLLEARLV